MDQVEVHRLRGGADDLNKRGPQDRSKDQHQRAVGSEMVVLVLKTPSATLGGRLSFKVINNDFLLKDED